MTFSLYSSSFKNSLQNQKSSAETYRPGFIWVIFQFPCIPIHAEISSKTADNLTKISKVTTLLTTRKMKDYQLSNYCQNLSAGAVCQPSLAMNPAASWRWSFSVMLRSYWAWKCTFKQPLQMISPNKWVYMRVLWFLRSKLLRSRLYTIL